MIKFFLFRFFLLITMVGLAVQLHSQNYVEIGTGTVSNTMPIYSSWNYTWSSLIYNHSDLGTAKSITKIALNCINGPKTVTNQKIYFKLTSNSVYANANYEDPVNNGYTLAYQGDLTFVNGWNEITLTTPIPYDGVQNISIHWENRWGTSYGPAFNSTSSAINNNKNCGNDSNFPLPSQAGYLNPYPSSLTNMRFYYASTGPATPTNPVPADNATNVSIGTSLSWQLGANTTSYDLYFGTNPSSLPLVVSNAPVSGPGTYTYTPPSLLADSVYFYWKVVAKNSSQQEASPVWKFKTEVVIDQFPYYQGFEDSTVFNTYPRQSAWVINPDFSWYQYNTQQHSGLLCAKTSWYQSGNEAIIKSPKILLPLNHTIAFFWKNTSANKISNHDTTYFEVTGNGGLTWVKVDTLAPATGNSSYIQRVHSLNAFAGNNCFFRFRHRTDNSGSAANVYLDDISIYANGGPTLTVTPPNQNVTSAAGTTQFTVTTTVAWTAVSNQTWCTVTPSGTGNGTLTANYTANSSGTQRVANITVSATGTTPVVVTVTQSASGSVTLTVTPPNQNVTAPAGSTQFTVTTTGSWTAVSNQSWCTVTASGTGNGTITANYTENTSGSQRVADITVTVTGIPSVVVTVTQAAAGPSLTVTPPNQNVSAPAGSTQFTVTSTGSWTAVSNQSWCTVTASGTGNGTITANYTENTGSAQRVANITVTVTGVTPVVVTVTQSPAAPTLSVLPSNQNVNAAPGTTSFSVNSNSSWTATSDQTWCSVTTSGSGNGTITATYTENTALTQRIATITVLVAGISPVAVTVTQAGAAPMLAVAPPAQNVSYPAGSTNFVVTSNINWTASSDVSWCTPTASGTGSGTLTATFQENTALQSRTATITVSGSGVTPVIVHVIQEAGPVGINDREGNVLSVYPNPTTGLITLNTGNMNIQDATVEILNSMGVKVLSRKVDSKEIRIDLSGMSKGVYLLLFKNATTSLSEKIVVR